jgi:hypothetical protein
MAATVEQLEAPHASALRALLSREPVQNLYLLGLLEEFGIVSSPGRAPFAFHGRFSDGVLTAAVFVGAQGGLVVPSADDPGEIAAVASFLAGKVRLRSSIGYKPAVDELVRHLCPTKPALSRSQRLYDVSADDLGPFTNPTLRLATEQDVPELIPLAAGAIRESLERDPLAEDAEGFRARVLQRVRGRRTYLLRVNDRLVFKIDVGSRSQYGAELEGLYTIDEERRCGHATLSLGQLSRHLLSSLPRLTLRVDDREPALAGVARKVGYAAGRVQRLVVSG